MHDGKIFIIAEAGINHNGKINLAFKLADQALKAGANAIKFQIFDSKNLVKKNLKTVSYQRKGTLGVSNQYEMLKSLELSKKHFYSLKKHCDDIGIEFIATPFDCESLNFLIDLNVSKIKISSGEITNGPLIWKAAKSNSSLIISTGMANQKEIKLCLSTIQHSLENNGEPSSLKEIIKINKKIKNFKNLKKRVSLLHCTSQYPTAYKNINLNVIKTLKNRYGLKVGLSDHSAGTLVAPVSIALGARIIEKHITLDKNMLGPDHSSSIEPKEFKDMVIKINNIYESLGTNKIKKLEIENEIEKKTRQRIIAIRDIPKGKKINKSDLGTIRSSNGKVGNFIWDYIGKISKKDLKCGQVIK